MARPEGNLGPVTQSDANKAFLNFVTKNKSQSRHCTERLDAAEPLSLYSTIIER